MEMKVRAVRTIGITEARDPDLIARINALAQREKLKPATAFRRFLDKHLPALNQKGRGQ